MTSRKIIGINLKYYRFKSGLSQEEFYHELKLSPKYLACVERGEINPTVDFLDKVCAALKIELRDLVTFDEKKIINQKRVDAKVKE